MKFFPSFISSKIERDDFLDELPEIPRVDANEDIESKRQEILEKIRASCSRFRAASPEEWKVFEENMMVLFGLAYTLDRRSPFDFLGMQAQKNLSVDSNYWALTKSHLSGQIEILDSIFKVIPLDHLKVEKMVVIGPPKKSSTFFLRFLDFLISSITKFRK